MSVVVGVRTPARLASVPDAALTNAIEQAADFEWTSWTVGRPRLPEEGWLSGTVDDLAGFVEPVSPIRAGYEPTEPSPAGARNYHGETDAPEGTFTAVTAGSAHSCGLRTDGTITCWGNNSHAQTDPPPGGRPFTALTGGWNLQWP